MRLIMLTALAVLACSSEGGGPVGVAPEGGAGAPSGGIGPGGASGTGGAAGAPTGGTGGAGGQGGVAGAPGGAPATGGASGAAGASGGAGSSGGKIPGCVPTNFCDCSIDPTKPKLCAPAACPTPSPKGAVRCCYGMYGPCGGDLNDGNGCVPCME